MLSCSVVLGLFLSLANARYSHHVTDLALRFATNDSGPLNQCCFVIQDHLSVNYWAHYFTSTWYGLRKVTSVISTVTQYQDTAITNYETITTIKNTTYATTIEVAENWVYASNAAPGPTLAATKINATTTTISDRVVTSPAGFFVYPSLRVINVPAITQADGELACTTASTYHLKCPQPVDSATFSGINSHVQAYYGGLSSSNSTSTDTFTVSRWSTLPGPTLSQVQITNQSTFTETGTATITNTTRAATHFLTTEISFPTPYLHFPSRGKTEVLDTGDLPQLVGQSTPGLEARAVPTTASPTSTEYDTLLADYGYVPQAVIDSLASDYPNLASCLPGGPSIIPIHDHEPWINISDDGCAAAAPGVLSAVPDLTTHSGATVKGEGCYHPGNCAKSTPAPGSTAAVALPENTKPASTASREATTSAPTQPGTPETSSQVEFDPIPMIGLLPGHSEAGNSAIESSNSAETAKPAKPSVRPIFGNPGTDDKVSESFNPSQTAKPVTSSAEDEVTAGGDTVLPVSSASLPAIVMATTTMTRGSLASGAVVTAAGHTMSYSGSPSIIEIGSESLILGSSAITISGEPFSFGSAGLVVGNSTIPLSSLAAATDMTQATQTSQRLGGIIAGAFGPHSTSSSSKAAGNPAIPANGTSTSPLAFAGAAVKADSGLTKILGILGMMGGLYWL